MQYDYETARAASATDLILRAADASLNVQGIKDQVSLSITGGASSNEKITSFELSYDTLDPDLSQIVFEILEDLAVMFAVTQCFLIIVSRKDREEGI